MEIKSVPTPRQFFVQCPKCGTYRISEKTARRFITPELRLELDKRLKEGAIGMELKFQGGCPNCEPNTTHTIELIALKPRLN